MKALSEKAKTQRAKIAATQREINRGNILEDTVASKINEDQDRSRKLTSERFKVSEKKIRYVHEIEDSEHTMIMFLGNNGHSSNI